MVDEAIITLKKGEDHAKRGEWSKSYACYAKSLELYNTKLTDVDIAQPMISECKAQMSRLSKHINESKTQPPERAHSRSAHSRSAHSRSATPITPIARVFTEPNRLPETTISNILSCYENVSSAQKKIEELQEIEVCESPPLLDESFYLVKPIDYTIEKMQRLVAEKNRQIEQLKKSYSDQFKHLKKAMEQLTQNDTLIFRDEMINKYTALKEQLKDFDVSS
ncbi:MAG: hypothetical protein MKZ63_07110 [Nitrospinales bacterium]|nr:hypothetical protein [Nitrospinales bacterium]